MMPSSPKSFQADLSSFFGAGASAARSDMPRSAKQYMLLRMFMRLIPAKDLDVQTRQVARITASGPWLQVGTFIVTSRTATIRTVTAGDDSGRNFTSSPGDDR